MFEKANQNLSALPGTKGLPLIGDLPRLLPNPLPFVQDLHARYGDVFYARFALNKKSVFVLGPAATEEVLVTKASAFSNALGYADQSQFLGEDGILFKDGEDHTELRRAINPAFSPAQLQRYVAVMDETIQEQMARWRGASPSLLTDINLLTLRIAAHTIIGVSIQDDAKQVNQHIVNMLRSMTSIAPAVPGTPKWRGLRSREWVQAFFRQQIAHRRTKPGDDVFSCLCSMEPELAEDVIVDNMVGMLAASYETTASAIAMMSYALAHNPTWQHALREELAPLLAADGMEVIAIRGCEQTSWVFKESLRLYSPLSYFPRRTLAEVQVSGRTIPANTAITIAPRFVHHMPEIYPAPASFDPERFAPARREDKFHSFAWMPFGKGAHTCAGMHFAQLEIFVFFAHLLKQFKIEPAGGRLQLGFVPILKPDRALPIRLVPL